MDSALSDAKVAVRSTKSRRYKLLSQNRLKIPNGLTKKYDYTKHMPLIQVDSNDDDSEDIDSRAFGKVSNPNLHKLLSQDRTNLQTINGKITVTDDLNEDEDDWDLSLTLPHPPASWKCGCLPVPGCTVS
ncbi:hypothetical protein FGIG_08744 [Fasciola gigantica]|uniref:Uncharacterized protein n=1 Tax=Fasciola gigantica TaxID=46835 RepID=A0A504X0I9_FASGI|nr:hypothetical protein FGIG_08744 [Fasciola gigantica]